MVNKKEFDKILRKFHDVAFESWKKELGEPLTKKDKDMCWEDLIDGAEDLKEFYEFIKPLIEQQVKKETAQELLKRIIELNDEQNVFNGQYILTAEDVQDVIRFYLRELKHIGEYKIEVK